MQRRTLASLGALSALIVAAPATGAAPNQGDASKVLTVDNPSVSCEEPTPRSKVEGGLGRTIQVVDEQPIDLVTVKSGKGATVVSTSFTLNSGEITLSNDVSNYVVWVCPPGSTDPTDPTDPTFSFPEDSV